MNLVYRHRSGGELWQGSIDDVNLLVSKAPSKIRTIGLFAGEHQDVPEHPAYEILYMGYGDTFFPTGPEFRETRAIADNASDHLANHLRRGRSVLSSCAMGFNRSGLVTALTIIKLGVAPVDAIRMVRQARGDRALSNPAFVQMVIGASNKQGDRATWSRWIG